MLALTLGKSQDLPFPPNMLMMELTDSHARNQTQVFKKMVKTNMSGTRFQFYFLNVDFL